MHYYQFNIGDYQSHTAHLSEMEDLAYRRLLDWAYLHEAPIPLDIDQISRLIRMRSHSDCIATVLQEFFVRTESGWVSHRVQQEIEAVGTKKEKARASANARWGAKAMRSHSDGNAPITHNPLPITQDPSLSIPNGIDSPSSDEPDQPSRFPKCEHQAVVDLYHQTLPTLPKVEVWNNLRAGLLRQRWREVCEDLTKKGPVTEQVILDWWRDFFVFVGKAPFLVGKTYSKDKRPFLADLEWIIRPTNFVKIVEGKYHRS